MRPGYGKNYATDDPIEGTYEYSTRDRLRSSLNSTEHSYRAGKRDDRSANEGCLSMLGCYTIFTAVVIVATIASLVIYLFETRSRPRTRVLVCAFIILPSVLVCMPWVLAADNTIDRPTSPGLTGVYKTHDSRSPSAILDLRGDGTYLLSGFAVQMSGSGRWR